MLCTIPGGLLEESSGFEHRKPGNSIDSGSVLERSALPSAVAGNSEGRRVFCRDGDGALDADAAGGDVAEGDVVLGWKLVLLDRGSMD